MELRLDVKPLLELLASLGLVREVGKILDPCIELVAHLLVSGVRIVEGASGLLAGLFRRI